MSKYTLHDPIPISPDGRISFIPSYWGNEYNLAFEDKDCLRVSRAALQEITSLPGFSTDEVIKKLEARCGGRVGSILEKNKLAPCNLHLALLYLRIMDQDNQIPKGPTSQKEAWENPGGFQDDYAPFLE